MSRDREPSPSEVIAFAITDTVDRLSNAVMPTAAVPAHDANGVRVGSLTEAVMGISAGLARVADAIGELAQAVREKST